ncbi:MAG: esterase/lipase family protein [Hydrogenophaga sp.]|jgi:pimeloyl-ACP methyl ester carboxylesterase|uniref:esterase/lipase family protein n=1 Tax=Hydrogenophaga sp. TaxID=1904254 RepID=UPI001D343926|nr:alpha/beta fold hydrolase [Hydrogenophaga sp.]MBW0171892.1 alpha/beta fold hydrolase [Hydrogenophaga sp.]MBW0186051.1 alpha/beta fold hydrolase [Hydrogenophaga sp.]
MSDHTTKPAQRVRPSRLARLQQVLVLGALLCAGAWLMFWWSRSTGLAVVGAVLILLGYAGVLALEGVAAARLNRTDAAPQAGWSGVAGAWWQEVRVAPQVFAWRQPFRWASLPDDTDPCDGAAPAVVFVHGFVCNRGLWLPWMARLRREGLPYVSVNLEPVFGDIDAYIPLMSDAVHRAHQLTGRPPVLICHSMGGLVARAWMAAEPDTPVHRVVTIGSPHRGTWLGRFSRVANGRQMRQEGEWLAALHQRESQLRPQSPYASFVCWYSNADNIVFPASTATLPGADNRLVPGAAHVALAFHPTVMDESLAIVTSAARSPSERTAA